MGPRSWDRGETLAVTPENLPLACLQWGRGLGTAESEQKSGLLMVHDNPSMGPRSWDRGEKDTDGTLAGDSDAPSMGPRSWDRGELAGDSDAKIPSQPSMGPRSWDRGEVVPATASHPAINLQWGRGLGTAESQVDGIDARHPHGPSMGPRSWDRGERLARGRRELAAAALQWGRGLGTAESRV